VKPLTQEQKAVRAMDLLRIAVENLPIFTSFMDSLGGDFAGRRGGYLCIRDNQTGKVLALAALGEQPEEKMDDRFLYSQEKGWRLYGHKSHFTSHQSRNKKKKQWGGAIRGKLFIISFSGFPEKGDSLFCLNLITKYDVLQHDFITLQHQRKILKSAKIIMLHRKYERYEKSRIAA
jgi:hypothetical protein